MRLVYILCYALLLHGCASRSAEVVSPCPDEDGGIRGRIVFQDGSPAVVRLTAHYEGIEPDAFVPGETGEEGRFYLELEPSFPWLITVSWTAPWRGGCTDTFYETFAACDLSPMYSIPEESILLMCI